jgi:NIMA (never in mitosis gene a)-related kinase
MKGLLHPRITRLVDFYYSAQFFNFVLEYAVNGSLRELITKYQKSVWRLPTLNLITFFMDVAYGLRFLHSKNIIHRDCKPENVLIDAQFRLKLCDFGVSKMLEDAKPHLQTTVGTLTYMSPEVYLHRPYDKSCDVWALGLILYELAFNEYLFTRAVSKSHALCSQEITRLL